MTLKDKNNSIINPRLIFSFRRDGNFVLKIETSGQTFTYQYNTSIDLDGDYLLLKYCSEMV